VSQEQILEILEKKGKLFATQIINELRIDIESKESIRRRLKQMRKYKEIGFIQIWVHNGTNKSGSFDIEFCDDIGIKKTIKEELLYKKFPELRNKKITRSCYLYYKK